MNVWNTCALGALGLALMAGSAQGVTVSAADVSGLAAEAEFSITGPTQITVRLKNISTGGPAGWTGAALILTGVSWDFGAMGVAPGDLAIVSGSVAIGPTSQSINFDAGVFGPGANVSGEYGYGNSPSGLSFPNFVSALQAGSTPFGGPNLDNTVNLDGPQGGLVANPIVASLGGLGAIQNEIIATLNLSGPITNLDFVNRGVRFEFGSDALFITTPTPGSMACLIIGGAMVARRRR